MLLMQKSPLRLVTQPLEQGRSFSDLVHETHIIFRCADHWLLDNLLDVEDNLLILVARPCPARGA
jgi:hypothetical protein